MEPILSTEIKGLGVTASVLGIALGVVFVTAL
jgi:hypothetical protein